MKRVTVPLLLLCLVALLVPAAAGAATSVDQAIDDIVARGYTVGILDDLTALGTDPVLGFRLAGSWAEHEASEYVRDELIDMGLQDVRLEGVPVDAWDFRGARVTVAGREMIASSFAGVPGTFGPVTAPLVYVGTGTAKEFDAAGDVTGKLVLVDGEFDDWWVNFVGSEATLRGAAGVVMTYGANTFPWYSYPDALGGNDGEYDDDFVSMVYVAWQDGDWIKSELRKAGGEIAATMDNDVVITLAENGGVGYNVVGVLPGKDPKAAPILLASHVDAHFRAGMDDTGAVAMELLLARALVESGARPERTLIFFFTCAEEYGYTDCWYDWAIGAWYAITEEHPEWGSELAMMLNIELMARAGDPMTIRGAADVMPFLEATAKASKDLLPYGYVATRYPSTWTDQWSFNAAGVPTVTIATSNEQYDRIYHTNLETKELVDHGYLGNVAKYHWRVIQRLDTGLLPYDMRARGDQLLGTIKTGQLARAGVAKRAAARFQLAAAEFRNAAHQWELRKASTPKGQIARVNTKLRALQETINVTFTGRDAWDFPAYPHQQPTTDAIYLQQAIQAAGVGNAAKAQQALSWYVGINWYASLFSPEVCKHDLERHYPDYEHITWGAMGSPPLTVDCIDEYVALGEGDFETAIAGLEEDLAMVQADLIKRVDSLTATLKDLTKQVDRLP